MLPVGAYSVSGEYAMVKTAAQQSDLVYCRSSSCLFVCLCLVEDVIPGGWFLLQ